MVRRTRVVQIIVDDLDGTELPEGEGQTIRYQWQGKHYELDVSDEHAGQLNGVMSPIIERSRSYKPPTVSKARQPALPAAGPREITTGGTEGRTRIQQEYDQRQAIREWGNANGHPQGAIGKIKEATKIAYYEAHPDAMRV